MYLWFFSSSSSLLSWDRFILKTKKNDNIAKKPWEYTCTVERILLNASVQERERERFGCYVTGFFYVWKRRNVHTNRKSEGEKDTLWVSIVFSFREMHATFNCNRIEQNNERMKIEKNTMRTNKRYDDDNNNNDNDNEYIFGVSLSREHSTVTTKTSVFNGKKQILWP